MFIHSYFNPYEQIQQTINRLPHWEQPGVLCAVTFRLADSLPSRLLATWEEELEVWLKLHPQPWSPATEAEYHRRFNLRMGKWLDAGHGSCLLRNREHAALVASTLLRFDQLRYLMISFVIMPNHVHALLVVHSEWPLRKLSHSWKSWSSKQIKKLGRWQNRVWQKDYHDRLIRDEQHFFSAVRYIRANPAALKDGEYLLWESEFAKRVGAKI